jgi:hypothetical protein
MPIQHALWRITGEPERIHPTKLDSEKHLEDVIAAHPEILDSSWMIIGRQVHTDFKGVIDLLALQPDGTPVIIELKRDKTPRDVLAQVLDYASWLASVELSRLQDIYEQFVPGGNLHSDFLARFGSELDEDAVHNDHLMVIVASELDSATERIVDFLSTKNININVLFFEAFRHGDDVLLSRSWFQDPSSAQTAGAGSEAGGTWNGEFYVSYGVNEQQRWEDAKKYGFITASGGTWYTKTLKVLDPGDRVWVSIPGVGYVGVGKVTGVAQPAADFSVRVADKEVWIGDIETDGHYANDLNTEWCAWFVPVEWIHVVDQQDAVKEVGFFGNQNTVAKPKSEKWEHTVARLKKRFGLTDLT